MKALIIGATGATGRYLVDELLGRRDYELVTIFVRKPTGKKHPKLVEHVIDFTHVQQYADLVTGDVLFSCLGTTLRDAGSKEKQWTIDFDIPVAFAEIARWNSVSSFILVSSYGASSKSRSFYPRMKGTLENCISKIGFQQFAIFRPGMLDRPGTDRWAEKAVLCALRTVNSIGLFKKYRPLPTPLLAQKLAEAPTMLPHGRSLVELDQIFTF